MALREIYYRLRNRLLTDAGFLSWVQRLPFGRRIARKRSQQLFDLLAGFTYSQTLHACVALGLFEAVGVAECDEEALVVKTGLGPERGSLLVKAAAALGLFERVNGKVLLGPHGAALVAQPWIMRFVEHHQPFYRDLEDPLALLRGEFKSDGLRSYWSYEDASADKSAYSALMEASQRAVSEQVLAAYDFGRHKRLLDVGGGTGAFLRAVGARHGALELNLFDLPGVVDLARREGPDRIARHGGDFRRDPFPRGTDIVTLVRVVHDHDDAVVSALFRNIAAALEPGATLLIAEPLAGNPATARVTDVYFNLYFSAMGQGRTRSPAEIAKLAAAAGFGEMRNWPTAMPLITGALTFKLIRPISVKED